MKQKVICILGMHRSGTSMITRIINLMDVYLGKPDEILQAQADNSEGFWEHKGIVNVHDSILSALDSRWESTLPLPDMWWQLPIVKKYKKELIKIINNEFKDESIWAFKDPRTCIMIPIWKEIFEELNLEPIFIIPIRNPIDVANSIRKRNNISLKQGIRLWYYYMINILEHTNSFNRLFINYDEVIENIEINLKKIINFLKIDISEEIKNIILSSVNPNLRHNKTNDDEFEYIAGKQVYELYNKCLELVQNCNGGIKFDFHSVEMYRRYSELMDIRAVDKKSSTFITSLYLDDGLGFREELSLKRTLLVDENGEFRIEFKLDNYSNNIKEIRWDPIEGYFCNCVIYNIMVNNKNTLIHNTNAFQHVDNEFDFFTDDPMVFININSEIIESVIISGKISFYDYEKIGKESQCELVELNKNIQVLNNKLLKSSDVIQELNNQIDKQKSTNSELVKKLDQLQLRYEAILNEKMHLTKNINDIMDSTSWKVTAPFRKIKSSISSKR